MLGWLYDAQSVMFAFAITAVYFGSLCVIGYTTKVNLMPLGRLLFVSLIILIIVEVVMMLMGFSTRHAAAFRGGSAHLHRADCL